MNDINISSDLIRGNMDAILLRVLLKKDSYGYEIIKTIWSDSGERYELKEPSLYSCLKRLEAQGAIEAYWGDESLGGRRKYYRITESGKKLYDNALHAWKNASELINLLIEGDNKE